MPANYPVWEKDTKGIPRDDSEATITRFRSVENVVAIQVKDATHRNCKPLTGVFELVSSEPQQVSGEKRFEVYCAWFGVKTRTRYPRISVQPENYQLIPNYTGKVIDNIARPAVSISPTTERINTPLPNRDPLPEEIMTDEVFPEGAVTQITVNAYERCPKARQRCIDEYGSSCFICDFDFGLTYGPEAQGYIHVHHLKPLSECGGEYNVDPVRDLRPVCPNCHAVIHMGRRSDSIRDIEDVKQLIKQQRSCHGRKDIS